MYEELPNKLMLALDMVTKTVQMFSNMIEVPMSELCSALWYDYLIKHEKLSERVINIREDEIKPYDVIDTDGEPSTQMLYLPGRLDPIDDNVIKYGRPVVRLMTPKITIPYEDVSVCNTQLMLNKLADRLKSLTNSIGPQLAKPLEENTDKVAAVSPICGHIKLSDDRKSIEVFMYTKYALLPKLMLS